MTFPNIPPEGINPIEGLDAEQVALLLLASIAFEELGLAHVINTEAEKLQGAIGTLVDENGDPINPFIQAGSLAELLEVNREVEKVLRTVIKKEMLLQFKFENVLEFLSTTTSTTTTTTESTTTTTESTTTTTESTTTTSTTSTASTTTCDCSTDWDFFTEHTAQVGTGTPQPGIVDTAADICPDCLLNGSFFNFRFASNDGTVDFTFVADVFDVINCPGSGNENEMFVTGTGHIEDGAVGIDPGPYSFALHVNDSQNGVDLELFNDNGTAFNTNGFVTDPGGLEIDECD
ncbi:hypothetical protein [Peribacillus asahii]|uniref:hypothetical protein n=1 Tax=Peribacillus asahii TaxID=228899 RepID=UPI0038261613